MDTLEKVQLLIDDESVEIYNVVTQEIEQLQILLQDNDNSEEDTPQLVQIIKHFITLCCFKEGRITCL
jgi:hypothetical protein